MEQIERLEKSNKLWRTISILSFVGTLVVTGFAFSQRDGRKDVPPPPAAGGFLVDKSPLPVTYTNFVQVSVTPEELVLDLGLNSQTVPDQPIRMSNRVVMSFFTAKRMSNALKQVVEQHEASYGKLELDFQKRLLPGAK